MSKPRFMMAAGLYGASLYAAGLYSGTGVDPIAQQPGSCSVAITQKWGCEIDIAQKWSCDLAIAQKWSCTVEVHMVSIPDGNVMVITSTFRLVSDSSLVDPTTVTAKIRGPGGLTTDTASKVSNGVYKNEITIAEAAASGTRDVRVYGTGAVVASNAPLDVAVPESYAAGN